MKELREKRDATEASEDKPTVEVLPADNDKMYYFKSKFRRDSITLRKPTKTTHADGTRTIDPGKTAEFEYNSWKTTDPWAAGQLRKIIEERPEIGIVETTPE
jgi:hypothetical protein